MPNAASVFNVYRIVTSKQNLLVRKCAGSVRAAARCNSQSQGVCQTFGNPLARSPELQQFRQLGEKTGTAAPRLAVGKQAQKQAETPCRRDRQWRALAHVVR